MCNGLRDSGIRQCIMNLNIPGSKPPLWLPKLGTHTGFSLPGGWGKISTSRKFALANFREVLRVATV